MIACGRTDDRMSTTTYIKDSGLTANSLKRTMGVVNVYKTHLFKFGLKFT